MPDARVIWGWRRGVLVRANVDSIECTEQVRKISGVTSLERVSGEHGSRWRGRTDKHVTY